MKTKANRPVIAINSDFVAANKFTSAYACLRAGYFDSLLASGGLPFILPPLDQERELREALSKCAGFVLSGGLDMDPRRQQLPPHPSVQAMAERREVNDQRLIRCLLEIRLPVLAIGVGMQQLNSACGGSLCQHIPSELPRALPHRDNSGGPHRHAVLLEPKTRLEEIYGVTEIRVNSDHHQAIERLGAHLRVSARAPDGVIEGIETTDPDWFCVGVQWHPESETASALDKQLFESFVQSCGRGSQPGVLAA